MPVHPSDQPHAAAIALFAAFEHAADATVFAGVDHVIQHINAAAERLWGCRRDDVVGLPMNALVPPAASGQLDHVGIDTRPNPAARAERRREFMVSRKDGSEAWGACSMSRVDYDGKTLHMLIIRDVTQDVAKREQDRLMALVAEKTDRAVMVTDRARHIVYVNNAFIGMFGYSSREALGQLPKDLLGGDYTDSEALARFQARVDVDGQGHEDLLVYDKAGQEIWISCNVNVGRNAAGEVDHLIAVLADITESKQINSLQHHTLENLANDIPVREVIGDLCRRVEIVAPDVVCSVLHVDAAGLLHPLGAPNLPPDFTQAIDGAAIGPNEGSCGSAAFHGHSVLVTDIASDPRWQAYNALPLQAGLVACWSTPIKARDGRVIGAFAFYFRENRGPTRWHQAIVDASVHLCALAIERHESRSEIARLAYTDALTGLPNRLKLREIMTRLIEANASDERIAVMFLDIDRFKDINDTLGHSLGDELLVTVTRRFREQIRPADMLSRQGGDEFVIVLPGCDADGAALTAGRLLAALLPPVPLGAKLVQVSASIGVSIYPDSAGDIDSLLKHADIAMYQAKQAGRSTCRFFSAEMNHVDDERRAIAASLRDAIMQDRLRLHYQPQVRADGRLHGVEALARWHDPVLGDVAPSTFIPLAEEFGLIDMVGLWSLREACRQIADWRADGINVPCVSVNLSPINFQNGDLAAGLQVILADHALSPDLLVLEVTERAAMSEHSVAFDMMKKIEASGVRLSMDDFGTGYSSIGRLAQLPIHELKVDNIFIAVIEHHAEALAMTRAMLLIGQSLDLVVVAEGVETEEQRRILLELGCDVIQGHVYAPALTVSEFESWLADHETSRATLMLDEIRQQAHPKPHPPASSRVLMRAYTAT